MYASRRPTGAANTAQTVPSPASADAAVTTGFFQVRASGSEGLVTLRAGMSAIEVERLLGKPSWTAAFGSTTRWDYQSFAVILEEATLRRVVQARSVERAEGTVPRTLSPAVR